jgi:hypothetical protein
MTQFRLVDFPGPSSPKYPAVQAGRFSHTKRWPDEPSTTWKAIYQPFDEEGHIEVADTEADARAKMLCYLLENHLLTP